MYNKSSYLDEIKYENINIKLENIFRKCLISNTLEKSDMKILMNN